MEPKRSDIRGFKAGDHDVLANRLAALALFGMTMVIQIFVYPDAWPTHLSWVALLPPLVAHGGGDWALDRLIVPRALS